jgi:hypothetical protein
VTFGAVSVGTRSTFAATSTPLAFTGATAGTRTTFDSATTPFLLTFTTRGHIAGQAVAGPPTGGSLADVLHTEIARTRGGTLAEVTGGGIA